MILIKQLEFVYCIDKNYNKQAFLSIASLLDNIEIGKPVVNIIHKSPRSFNKFRNKLSNLYPNLEINLFKFKYKIKNFPNLKNSHVSEATYYRIFIANHINSKSKFVIYLDADAFIVSNPIKELNSAIKELQSKNLLLAAKTTDYFQKQESLDIFQRLNMNDKYFNAGVLVINMEYWIKNNISQKLQDRVWEIKEDIVYWDQDVLNSFVNGKYVELADSLNCIINIEEKIDESKTKIIH